MPERAFHDLADHLTSALIGRDFVLYQSLMKLPLVITPREGQPYVLQTIPDLRADFDAYCDVIRAQGVTDIYRQIIDVQVGDAEHISVRFLTHIMVRAHRIFEPFETQFLMLRGANGWQISAIESTESHIKWTLGQIEIDDGNFNEKPE